MKRSGSKSRLIARSVTIVVVLAGYIVEGIATAHDHGPAAADAAKPEVAKGQTWWTCSMHPPIRQQKPGKCPLCFMDLIEVSAEASDIGPRRISFREEAGKPLTHLTIYSPISGVVVEKNATEGMYVDVGTRIYTIADLSKLWVKLDAYESDLPWIRYGQEVEFSAEAYRGEAKTSNR